ncbi:MAG: FAD-dependent oxidoreductase, partial [Thermodesulfobacteriota bacterium]|nr:FAD-dependent oxidoreductase [Thermodesulfobacteriota bacterium]
LRSLNLHMPTENGKTVIVIGGGDVAIDTARAAVRKGADSVKIFYRRTRKEMPAQDAEVSAAQEEGIETEFLVAPIEVLVKDGKMTGLRCQRMELGKPDASGRRRPVPIEGSEFTVPCDLLIPAIGQKVDLAVLEGTEGVEISKRGTIVVDQTTYETTRSGLFAGGDLYTGPSIAVEAVAAGKEAAYSIKCFLNGEDMIANRPLRPSGEKWAPIPDDIEEMSRIEMSELDADKRKLSFDEVEVGFTEEEARAEASRCLACGVCCECKQCVPACEAHAIEHDQKDEIVALDVGSIILATGFDAMDPTPMEPYGYSKFDNVITNLEFERLSNATGPTSGKILLKDPDNRWGYTNPPQSVAFLHCIGSRDTNYHEYCSRTCCMYALKMAHLVKDKCGHETQVYNFYIDMRCFGKGYEEFYRRIQDEGVRMIRGKAVEVTDQAEDPSEEGLLVVRAEDTLTGKILRVPVEMVVLCTAMEPRPDAPEVARTFGLSLSNDGFFMEEHPKLEPVSTPTSGVFLAGACQGPKDIPDSVAQAKAAASEAQSLSTFGDVVVLPMISHIDEDICVGCQICIDLCAYGAIEYDELRSISVINEAVCKGCGSCSAYCPSGAAGIRHFTQKQIFAEIEGILAN